MAPAATAAVASCRLPAADWGSNYCPDAAVSEAAAGSASSAGEARVACSAEVWWAAETVASC